MRTALLSTCRNEFHSDPKYPILVGGLPAESDLNNGQTFLLDMRDRLLGGMYGQLSELALTACTCDLEIIVFENGTQKWIQKPIGTHQQRHNVTLRRCRGTTQYDWLKRVNSDEPERANPSPVLHTQRTLPNYPQDTNRARQPKNKFSRIAFE
jgi:hypothetical protein